MPKRKDLRVAINGFGRIGRAAFKIALEKGNIQIVGINDLTNIENLAYLLKYDSAYGRYPHLIETKERTLVIDRKKKIPFYFEHLPEFLPWKKLEVDVVLECTGMYTTKEEASKHLQAGAKAVVISAPTKSEDVPTVIFGVNELERNVRKEPVISNASCTTNSVAPIIDIIHRAFRVEKAILSTIHAVTSSQRLVDSPDQKDMRRGRAAAFNIIPTSTGAAIATTKAIPALRELFDGIAIRVPVITGSLSDITMLVNRKVNAAQINDALRNASVDPRYRGILEVTDDPMVSSDVIGSSASTIVDLSLTRVVDVDLVKVIAWYDNEWGYSHRLVEQAQRIYKGLYAKKK